MKSLKSMLSSPKRIAAFAICAVIIVGLIALGVAAAVGSISNNQGIGLEKATNVALQNAGYTESEVKGLKGHYDRDDGLAVYEIEFWADGFEYDYTITADDGTILEANREGTVQIPSQNNQPPAQNQAPADDQQQPADDQQQPADSSSSQNSGNDTKDIGVKKAKEIALSHAGINASEANFVKAKRDRDDGVYVYEIEFISGETEYDYEINANTGSIIGTDTDSIYD